MVTTRQGNFDILRAVIIIVGTVTLCVVLYSVLQATDDLTYGWAYADGHVRRGLWSPGRGETFRQEQTIGFLLYSPVVIWAFQIIGVLGLTWTFMKAVAILEHSVAVIRWYWIVFLVFWLTTEILLAPLYNQLVYSQLDAQFQQLKHQLEQ